MPSDQEFAVALSLAGCSLDSSPGTNWVEAGGGLPQYICRVARALIRSGHPKGMAIAIAVSRMKAWASGRGKVDADTRAKAAAAVAEWEALKAKAKGKHAMKTAAHVVKASSQRTGEDYLFLCDNGVFNVDRVKSGWQAQSYADRSAARKLQGTNSDIPIPYFHIKEMWSDALIIQDDDGGELFKVPFSVDQTTGLPTFGEPQPVVVQYAPSPVDNGDVPSGANTSLSDDELDALLGLSAGQQIKNGTAVVLSALAHPLYPITEGTVELAAGLPTGANLSPDTDLTRALKVLLGETVSLYFKAHGAHWNVQGDDFAAYHAFFAAVYEDLYDSIDPLAENIRKLGQMAPYTLPQFDALRTVPDAQLDTDPDDLLKDLLSGMQVNLKQVSDAFDIATTAKEQGIANFLAGRDEQLKKWCWQMNSMLAFDGEDDSDDAQEGTAAMSGSLADQLLELAGNPFGGKKANPFAKKDEKAPGAKPYGDVKYADPKNGKYPVDTEEHAKAAWAYINKPKNAAVYPLNGVTLESVKSAIKAACKKFGIEVSDSENGEKKDSEGKSDVLKASALLASSLVALSSASAPKVTVPVQTDAKAASVTDIESKTKDAQDQADEDNPAVNPDAVKLSDAAQSASEQANAKQSRDTSVADLIKMHLQAAAAHHKAMTAHVAHLSDPGADHKAIRGIVVDHMDKHIQHGKVADQLSGKV